MNGFNPAGIMEGIARKAIANQERRPGDFINDEGFLVCGVCKAQRQRFMDVADPMPDDPNHTRRMKVTTLCECEKEEERKRKAAEQAEQDMEKIRKLRSASLMDAHFAASTFENFQQTKYNGKNLTLCRRYAQKFDTMLEKNQGLLLWGPVGTGKSFAAACIANYLLEHKVPVMMTSFVKLLEAVQFGREDESDIIRKLNRAKLVIFDDLGAERSTDYAIERVYNIVDSRYRSKLPMILTTNLTIEEMKQEEDIRYTRIYDRVFETCYPMQFTGPSLRKKEASRRFNEMEALLSED